MAKGQPFTYSMVRKIPQPILTSTDNTTIDDTYGTVEEDVLNNIRTRLNELETRLRDAEILT